MLLYYTPELDENGDPVFDSQRTTADDPPETAEEIEERIDYPRHEYFRWTDKGWVDNPLFVSSIMDVDIEF